LAGVLAILLGIIVVAIALNHSLNLLRVLLVFAGATLTATNISINSFLQENADNQIRGRVASLYQLALYGGISIGALATGFSVSKLNISTALAINGGLAVVFQACLLWRQLTQKL
jgi:MFS family permease